MRPESLLGLTYREPRSGWLDEAVLHYSGQEGICLCGEEAKTMCVPGERGRKLCA